MSDSDKNTIRSTINHIIQTLGETDKKPIRQITNIVKLCGVDFANDILQETLNIEANGGMTIQNGDRRRTIGGVFFYLAREKMSDENRQQIFYSWRLQRKQRAEREAQFPEFNYDNERVGIISNLLENVGKVSEVNITLTGRPEAIERRRDLVILTIQDEISEETVFPRGVPQPDPTPIDYAVYISAKQWERVEKVFNSDTDDDLVIEGMVAFDSETGAMAVYSTFVTTDKLRRKKKKQDKQNRKNENGSSSNSGKQAKAPKAAKKEGRSARGSRPPRRQETSTDYQPVHSSQEQQRPPEPEIEITLPDGIPADVAEKLMGLHKAAATFRQKIATLEAKPADEQFGLEMTQKLLKNTESQIEKLEQQYKGD